MLVDDSVLSPSREAAKKANIMATSEEILQQRHNSYTLCSSLLPDPTLL